jgi:hypothetical protein
MSGSFYGLQGRRHRLRRAIIKLVVVLVVLGGLLEVADIFARHVAEDTIAGRAVAATSASSASASISGWPFLYGVLVEGSVPGTDVVLTDVPIGRLVVQRLDLSLSNVAIDTGALFSHQTVDLKSIGSARVAATVTAAELSAAADHTIRLLGNGNVEVVVDGVAVPATVSIGDGHELQIGEGTTTLLDINLSSSKLVPDCAMTLSITTSALAASCTVSPVPKRVLEAISGSS